MEQYTTNPPRAGRENERPTSLETLGGEFGLSWNDTVPLTTEAHNAFLGAFVANVWNIFAGSAATARTRRRP